MQPLQMQIQIPNGMNNNNLMMNNNNGVGFMASSQQQFGAATNGVNVGPGAQTTLELKAVCSSLRPNDFGGDVTRAMARQSQLFHSLPREEAVLLTLIECFTFQYRNRLPHELSVMPNATLYFTRLSRSDSPLKNRMEYAVGFRCCACRHTSQTPDQYIVGSTQLICMDFLDSKAATKIINDLKSHILNCPLVSDHVKASLTSPTTSISPKHSSMKDYLTVWHESLLEFAKLSGYPKITQKDNSIRVNNAATNRIMERLASQNGKNSNNLANGNRQEVQNNGTLFQESVMQDALRVQQTYLQPHRPSQSLPTNRTPTTQQIPTVDPLVEVEDEVFQDLDLCISTALSNSNFGLEVMKSRTLASDLTELPISKGALVSPLMELLLQSYCLTLRENPSALEPGRQEISEAMDVVDLTNTEDEKEELDQQQPRGPKVYFECGYCDCQKTRFCLTTGDAREAAIFINSTGLQHLTEECEALPYDVRDKLSKLKDSKSTCHNNHHLVEHHFASWKAEFGDSQAVHDTSIKTGGHHVRFWRPLSWRFVEQVGASAISDQHSGMKGEKTTLLPADPSKKLPYAQRDNDVLIGWDGAHIGNRQYMDLLNECLPAFQNEGLSDVQRKLIAGTAVRLIGARGGRFYSVSSNYATVPPVLIPPDKAALITLDILKYGASILLQPPPDNNKTGPGSRVLDFEFAPQRDVFGTEIIHNKPVNQTDPRKE